MKEPNKMGSYCPPLSRKAKKLKTLIDQHYPHPIINSDGIKEFAAMLLEFDFDDSRKFDSYIEDTKHLLAKELPLSEYNQEVEKLAKKYNYYPKMY